jgi:hypothetical protein
VRITQPDSGIAEKASGDTGEHELLADPVVVRSAKNAPNPALGINSDRPEALWIRGWPQYHRCHRAPRVVLRVGVCEVRCEEHIAVHDNHRSLWVIKRTACFSEAATGPEQDRFTGKSKLHIARAGGF